MPKRWGLLQARGLRNRRPDADPGVVATVLAVLGIPNRVKQEVAVEVARYQAAVERDRGEITLVQQTDLEDGQRVLDQIERLEKARAERASANKASIVHTEAAITAKERAILDTQDLLRFAE